ncbi:hypothetical protein F4678DRAFT_457225 [Xylaria arbuscula]|nr:hypothetical protein F4678DRAFT_457225 [Xylaria arbuscula]
MSISSYTMRFRSATANLPHWARDISLLRNKVRNIVITQVKVLNRTGRSSYWYDPSLTTAERAEMILGGIYQRRKPSWNARDLDEFVGEMIRVVWADYMYDRRAQIMAMDAKVNYEHQSSDSGDLSRERAYKTCAIQILADVLDDLQNQHTQRSPSLQSMPNGTTTTGGPQKARDIKSRTEVPDWVRRPEILDLYFQEQVLDMIREIDDSREEPGWRRHMTVEERAKIIHTQLQRRWNRRVRMAVERRRPMAAIHYVFDSNFAERLRTEVYKEMEDRRHTHPSTWNRTCGIWLITERVIVGILKDREEAQQQRARENVVVQLTDRLSRLLKGHVSSSGGWFKGPSRLKIWGKYSV